jgi:hypothetical protein
MTKMTKMIKAEYADYADFWGKDPLAGLNGLVRL